MGQKTEKLSYMSLSLGFVNKLPSIISTPREGQKSNKPHWRLYGALTVSSPLITLSFSLLLLLQGLKKYLSINDKMFAFDIPGDPQKLHERDHN